MNLDIFQEAKKIFAEGIKLIQNENFSLAEKKFIKCLDLFPGRLSVIHNLISIYIKTNQKEKLSKILENYKNLAQEKEILYGTAFHQFFLKNFSKSIELCKQIIQYPQFQESIEDLLASNYKKKKLFLDALKIYKKKLMKNKNALNYYNIGNLFSDLGKTQTAYYYLSKSKSIKNDDYSTLWNLSLCALRLKYFKEGFLLYENRWLKKNDPGKKKFNQIKLPSDLNEVINKNILIWDEQGLGDTLQFSRFVIELLKFSKKITFVVNSKLSEILSGMHKNIKVTSYENLDLNSFEYQIPLCSLPKYLNIKDLKDINYYQIQTRISNNKDLIKNNNLNIGISWSGNPNYSLDNYRSISFKQFKDLFKIENINFYKLSQNVRTEEYLEFSSLSNLTDFGEKSLYEVSQIIPNLDLVISSDTSIIHLAGILNVKSYLLLNYNSDWRWFNDKKDTIWYPSVEIIKQDSFDSWDNVIKELKTKIENLTSNSK
jgi:tetratricopeptide (TPR) repeat protein